MEHKKNEDEKQKKKEMKAKRKNVNQFKEVEESDGCLLVSPEAPEEKIIPRNAQQMWTDDDLIELARLIKKIPGGSTDRLVVCIQDLKSLLLCSGGIELQRSWKDILMR